MYRTFQQEIERLKSIQWTGYHSTKKAIGISYLGNVAISAKLHHSLTYSKVATYGIYLSSADQSGYNVCPNSTYCKENCLNGSGHNKVNRLAQINKIDQSRILKTRLFFVNKPVFMQLLIHEIKLHQARAIKKGYFFAVRLNCTSDINPIAFKYNNQNILDIFPNIQFYDYTKVENRINLLKKYPNYDITWSIDGSTANKKFGINYIKQGGKVAVVYGTDAMPTHWQGYKTENGDLTDYRVNNIAPVIMLKFKRTANNYKNGQFIMPNINFIFTGE